ncbi:isoflavone reductase family protein [Penicillium chrysogenum]|nr:isoflavone reductase family protein [Penicillium chrysogenum]
MKRFVPSAWVGPALRGVIDIKDKKLEILGEIQRNRLPYTIIDVGSDPRTINRRVLAYTEVLSTNGIWDVVARVTGEEPPKSYERSTVLEEQLHDIIAECRKRLQASSKSLSDPNNSMDTANFNMGQ